MNKEQAKKLLPIIEAIAKGETIQKAFHENMEGGVAKYYSEDELWHDLDLKYFDVNDCDTYRVKPEPKYRPFKNAEECWNEMLKHQPFGWIRIEEEAYVSINTVGETYLFLDKEGAPRHYDRLFRDVTFADGQPFGVLG